MNNVGGAATSRVISCWATTLAPSLSSTACSCAWFPPIRVVVPKSMEKGTVAVPEAGTLIVDGMTLATMPGLTLMSCR